jgi:hypothetical protein
VHSNLFPNLSREKPAMRQVSPTDHRRNSDIDAYKKEPVDLLPSTPTTETRAYDRGATISPSCRKPSGMENLIA